MHPYVLVYICHHTIIRPHLYTSSRYIRMSHIAKPTKYDRFWRLREVYKNKNGKKSTRNLASFYEKPIRYIPLLLQGDILEMMEKIPDNSIDLAFADPPYGVGIDYGTRYYDNKKFDDYIDWCGKWINLTFQKLKKGGSFYLMNYPKQSAYLQVRYLDKLLDYRNTIHWRYESNIGMSAKKFSIASRHILFYTKGDIYTFNKDEIVIPYRNPNDKRIIARMKEGSKGKTPYDWWVFDIDMNLTKNVSREKITNILGRKENTPPNQLPEELIKRIVRVSSNRGDTVLSLFAGSGTDLVVCCDIALCRKAIGIELNPYYCKFIKKRLEKVFEKKISNLDVKDVIL